ncbi:hypothetical protein M3Y97_01051100 [Aphelenchoides bicaudatus]|nr:hypothetical protein M3Y97_01051100 [Aphelenchoides bicaudatus]
MTLFNFTRRCYARLIYAATLFLIAILFVLFLNKLDSDVYDSNVRQYFFPSTHKYDRPFNFSNFNKYILLADKMDGGRHGNILFRVGSLYGIGKQLDRISCMDHTFTDDFRSELRTVFPNLHNYVLLDNCWDEKAKVIKFENVIWNYVNVSKLEQYANEKSIRLETGVLECLSFFGRFRQGDH